MKTRGLPMPAANRRLQINLSYRSLAIGVVVVLCLGQAVLGGDLLIIGYCVMAICFGLIPIWLFGINSSIGMFFALLLFFFPVSALLVKTCLLQTIQSGLFVPDLTFEVMVTGMAAASAATALLYFCKQQLRAKPLFQPLSPAALRMLILINTPVAVFGIFGYSLPGALGRIAALTGGLIFLSLAAATQLALIRSKGARGLSLESGLFLVFCVFYALAVNSKQGFFATGSCYLMTVYLYRNRIDRFDLLLISLGSVILFFVVAPAINVAREIREDASAFELIERTISVTTQLLTGNSEELTKITNYDFGDDNYYTRYVSDTTSAIDRFVFVSYLDSMLRFTSDKFMGYAATLNYLVEAIMPNLFDPGQKAVASAGDKALQYYGIFSDDLIAQITLPVFGEGYVVDGFVGVIILTFMLFLVEGASLIFILGDLRGNVFAQWWIALNGFVIAGTSVSGALFQVFRITPIYIILYLLAKTLSTKTIVR